MRFTPYSNQRRSPSGLLRLAFVFIATSASLIGLGAVEARAQSSSVTVLPTRLVMEPGERTGQLRVVNRSEYPTVYRAQFENKRMTEEGRLERVTDAEAKDMPRADDMLRFSPRRVLLKPGEAQTVRVMVRRPRDLEAGEYRSRVLFKAEPHIQRSSRTIESDDEVHFGFAEVSAVSIPIIVRHGSTRAHVSMDKLQLIEPDAIDSNAKSARAAHLALRLKRSGDRSVYGKIVAVWVPNDGGRPVPVGIVSGLAVYTEVEHVDLRLKVHPADGGLFENGTIVVRYFDSEKEGSVLAKAKLRLP